MPLVRNLTAAEIVGQVLVARDRLGDFPGGVAPADGLMPKGEGVRAVSNIVFMGMGEPLYNYEPVRDAIAVSDRWRRALTFEAPRHRLDLGRCPGDGAARHRMRDHAGGLAACDQRPLRDQLVPLNRKYPIEALIKACRDYPGASNARRITFEYVMLKGVNDLVAEANALVRLLERTARQDQPHPVQPVAGQHRSNAPTGRRSSASRESFSTAGYASPVRTPRGRDILAACGQLKSQTEKLRARARLMLEESSAVGQE